MRGVRVCLAALALLAVCRAAAPPGFITTKLAGGYSDNTANIVTKTRHLPDGRVMLALRLGAFYISADTAPLHPTLLFAINPANFYVDGEIGCVA